MTETAFRRVRLNGEVVETAAADLASLLAERGFADLRVATALNGMFVPTGARTAHPLVDGDQIEVVSARQGG